ncbi:AI-2E family transporter [Acholeplasma granularum]|uniref:AI-2E family transporter n=1 Tax=Acholeplasma granularum TaxID=264635 RepID=UPI00046ECA30|nr:AI-2E family transporter [Acholeplasma granularum]
MKKINFKFLNILLLLLIIILVIYIWPNINGTIIKAFKAILPLIIAFTIAYILNPLINLLQKYKIPRWLGVIIVYSIIVLFFIYLVWGVVKPAIDTIGNLSLGIENIMIEIGDILNVDTSGMTTYIVSIVDDVVLEINNFFSAEGGTVGQVWNVIVGGAVVIVVGIIFIINFPKIRERIKEYLSITVKPKTYSYIQRIDKELTTYLWAEVIIAGIQAVQYGGLMLILALFFNEFWVFVPLVAIVAAILSLIPYFGGHFSILFTAIIVMTVPSAAYGMIAIGVFILIFPQLDAYVINPKIYQTQLRLNPILTIAFVLLGQTFFGIIGAILSVPIQVILEVTMQYYKENIKKGIKNLNQHL